MKKNILLFMAHVIIFSVLIYAQEYYNNSSANNEVIEGLYKDSTFNKWMIFWKSKITEINDFEIDIIDTIKWRHANKINLNEWLKEKQFRHNTLRYSPSKNYLIDIYSNRRFEIKNNEIYVSTSDVDEYFEIINMEDSLRYQYTSGAYSFYDETIWLNNTCYILGFSFDDSKLNSYNSTFCKMIIIKWDLDKDILSIITTKNYPFSKEYMSFSTYMRYLYPKFKM